MAISVDSLLYMTPDELKEEMKFLTQTQVREFQSEADHRIQKLAHLSAYLEARGATGCGDAGHAEGLKEGTKLRKKVRKALGYTSP